MSKFSKKLKKVVKAAINPVGAGIEKVTGISQGKQLGMGALIGTGAGLVGALGGGAAAAAGSGGTAGAVGAGTAGAAGGFWSTPFAGGLLSGGLGLAGNLYGANMLAEGQQAANEASVQSAREQMQFQERMSSTAHQREVEDLRAAGLNPVLSANAGASSPSGESVTFQNESPDYRNAISGAITSALEARRLNLEARQANMDYSIGAAQRELINKQTENAANSAKISAAEARIRDAESVGAELESEFLKRNPRYIDIKKALDLVNPIVGTARDVALTYRGFKGLNTENTPFGKRPKGYMESREEFLKSKGAIPKDWDLGPRR